MGLKSVEAGNEGETAGEDDFEMEMRQRARKVISEVFGGDATSTCHMIEKVTQAIILTDEDGFDEEAIAEELGNLKTAREWAGKAYGDTSVEATLLAYDVLYGMTMDEKIDDLNERLEKLSKRKS